MTPGAERRAARVRAIRSRVAVRRWELRQLRYAAGAWYRLARVLAKARAAWSIGDEQAEALIAAGRAPEAAGLELEPPIRVFTIAEAELAELGPAQPLDLRASPELLACRNLVVVPFVEAGEGTTERVGSQA